MIGYLLQSAIGDEMWLIGKFYTREEAQRIQREKGFVTGGAGLSLPSWPRPWRPWRGRRELGSSRSSAGARRGESRRRAD